MTETAAHVIAATLEKAGVKRFYGVVGDSLNGFTDALRERGKMAAARDCGLKTVFVRRPLEYGPNRAGPPQPSQNWELSVDESGRTGRGARPLKSSFQHLREGFNAIKMFIIPLVRAAGTSSVVLSILGALSLHLQH